MQLLCITPNPAVDRTVVVPGFRPGLIYRPEGVLDLAGGKGINVARAARALGAEVCVTGPLAGTAGERVEELARAEGLAGEWLRVAGESRTCLSVVDPDGGVVTDVNLPGPTLSPQDWGRLVELAARLARAAGARAATVSGSLPAGVGVDGPAELSRALTAQGVDVAVDAAGPVLQAAAAAAPALVKGNREEVASALGVPIGSVADAIAAARALVRAGARRAVVTLGAEGAVAAEARGRELYVAQAPALSERPGAFRSAVGCGDVLLGALMVSLYGRGEPLGEALRHGVAAATANLLRPGAAVFDLEDAAQLRTQVVVRPA